MCIRTKAYRYTRTHVSRQQLLRMHRHPLGPAIIDRTMRTAITPTPCYGVEVICIVRRYYPMGLCAKLSTVARARLFVTRTNIDAFLK